jgi:hypothetical protein
MSVTNYDKDRIEKRKLIKGMEAPLRDQVVKKLYNKCVEDNLADKLDKAYHTASASMQPFLDKQKVYVKDLHDFSIGDSGGAFEGSSQLHLPMSFIVCKTYHARFMSALLGVDPPFSVKARREDGVDAVQYVEDLMRYTLKDWANYYKGIDSAVDGWLWSWITAGVGVMKIGWDEEIEQYTDVTNDMVPGLPQVVNDPTTGRDVLIPTENLEEREIVRTIRKFSGPCYTTVQLEDFLMVGGKGDPDAADMVFHRGWMTASELWQKVNQNRFDADAVEKVIQSGRDAMSGAINADIKHIRADDAGKAQLETEADFDRYEIMEVCLKHDTYGTGVLNEIVVWYHKTSRQLLRATYLRRIQANGERPYSVIHFHKRPEQDVSAGLLEVLHPLTKELDALHNIRIDTGLLMNNPIWFYRAASGMDPSMMQLEPGVGIPLDNPQTDVYFPPMPNKTAFTAQEEQVVMSYIERLTGVSDLSLGVQSGTQGAARTASGVKALLGENNANLDVQLRRMNMGWKKLLKTTFSMLRDRMDPKMSFRVTGNDGANVFRTIYSADLPDCDFELSANSSNSNKQVQIETAQQAMSVAMNPINLQLGVSDASTVYESQRVYLQSIGIKDTHRFLKKPQGFTLTLDPMEEFQRIVRGQEVPLSPNGDHEGFIAFAETMIQAQDKEQTLSEAQIGLLINQMRKHKQMKDALDQQAAQQAVSQQMQINANQGAPDMGAAFNPVQGNPGALPAPQ